MSEKDPTKGLIHAWVIRICRTFDVDQSQRDNALQAVINAGDPGPCFTYHFTFYNTQPPV